MRRLLPAAVLVLLSAGAAAAPPGAEACSGCHPATRAEGAPPPLAGQPADDIAAAMQDFRTGQRPATVMDRIAKGFTDEEIRAIAVWVARAQ
ncbi:c-type cytochrome [Azospirillum sp. TSO22-1]|uniref:c-type cytochrome n=1 Tax=Azospirillum sp. TSO22-1 TaxID=716789 RepID=UPI000D617BC5|nr:c-type cytochrome [Azospirillum sp. TSO22-1]PWC31731.1 hypothetical protein TSO221_33070 [Azospirillum sp. TSO22-1]